MMWLVASCLSCLLFTVVSLGTFVPFQNPEGVEYFFAAPALASVVVPWLLSIAGLTAGFLTVNRLAGRVASDVGDDAASGRWLAPIAALAFVVFGLLPAIKGIGERGSIAGFVLYDLRWWWALAAAALALARADRLIGAPVASRLADVATWSTPARLIVFDGLLFFGVIAWALLTTVNAFDNRLYGDEPKYVRYGEVWYQGQGLDVGSLALVSDEPLDAHPPLLRNTALLLRAIPIVIGAAANDLQAFARSPHQFKWNRASAYNTFVTGIHGGLYQQYSPGMSVFLFPGYFVDRYLLNVDSSRDGKWPANLTMTRMMMLLTYGLCAVMLFRLLRNALESEVLAAIWAAIAMLTLPTTAFAFQLYPELPALLVITAVSNELLFGSRTGLWSSTIAGAAAGALGWFHVRFLLVGGCLVAFGLMTKRGRARAQLVAASAFFVLSLMMFNYYVTGSWWPTALWDANEMGVSFGAVFVRNFIGYGFDRRWGLLPHSLVLVAALPGLFVLARRSRLHAAFVTVIVAGLVTAAAGHTLIGAATTPDRLILAVTPLLIWPVAVAVREFWSVSAVRVVAIAFAVVSLDAGRAYNRVDAKAYGGLLQDMSLSGWKPNLGFPDIRGDVWDASYTNLALFLCLVGIVAALSALAYWRASRRSTDLPPVAGAHAASGNRLMIPAVTMAALMIGFAAMTSVNGDWAYGPYLAEDPAARAAAVRAVVDHDACFCFTSARGRVDWSSFQPNSAKSALVDMFPDDLRMMVLLLVQGDGATPAFGRMRVEFGDGEQTAWTGVLGEHRVEHAYARPGTYQVRVWFQLPARVAPQLHMQTVEIRSRL